MQKFALDFAKIVGTPTKNNGAWVHIFPPQKLEVDQLDQQKLARRGRLFAVVGLKNFTGSGEMMVLGKEIISRLQEEYYGDLSASAFDQLKKAVKKVVNEAQEGETFSLEIGVAAIVNNVLYSVLENSGKLLVNRNDQKAELLKPGEAVSGFLQVGDTFLLATDDFFRLVPPEKIEATFKSVNCQEAVESLAPLVHEQPNAVAAIVLQILPKQPQAPLDSAEQPLPELRKSRKTKISFNGGFRVKQAFTGLTDAFMQKIRKRVIHLKAQKEKNPKSTRNLMSVAFILLILLGVSVFFGMRQRQKMGVSGQTYQLIEQIKSKQEEAQGLLSLNPAKSKQLLQEAKALVDQANDIDLKNPEFLATKESLETLMNSVLQEYEINGEAFFDLEIIKKDARGDDLAFWQDYLIVLDKSKETLYQIEIESQKSEILAGGQDLQKAQVLTGFENQLYVGSPDGIFEVDQHPDLIIEEDQDLSMIDLVAFAGNLYLLDSNGIWKYPAIETGFGNQQTWLDQDQDFGNALQMAIDGSVWVLFKNGEVSRFTQGSKDAFRLSGLNKPLGGNLSFYTDADLDDLYLLDTDNQRLVVFDKSGEFKSDYHWDQLGQATSLIVLPDKRVFCLLGSKVYNFNLP